MMDVSALVSQMHDTLSTIHSTIASLDTSQHDAKLDELEQKRESAIRGLLAAFAAENESLSQKRKTERDEIAERRRREDEEREKRRRLEDEELAQRDRHEDEERDGSLKDKTKDVEEETEEQMVQVEEEAKKMLEEGRAKLSALEERRRELNRLIDERLQMPLPTAPTRARRGLRTGLMPAPAVAAQSS
ncbi:hypothetical protein QBC46DRAFT_431043 [Diplogelasinospora grovesii]|uniref:Uncharacterized protein n=1 Tax=Diplogelasinospora grovesii TaxID=303347 RepID=A0AAN6RZ49_9PEZI|nr:hypothetical protein QBC46DRAFT_431043 [Diplogelasinospora grovesii]